MDSLFLDNFINEKELTHLAKEVKKKQLDKAICAIERFHAMQTAMIKKQRTDVYKYLQKRLSDNAKKHF